jgi:predicted naringenin-chalcone synthase
MNKEICLHSFESILPAHSLPQNEIVDWTVKSHLKAQSFLGEVEDPEKFESTMRRFCLNDKFISKRYFEIGEVDERWDDHRIYKITKESPNGASIEERNLFFGERAETVFAKLYAQRVPNHVVHVTCTGYISPSPAQVHFSKKQQSTAITHAYHMGCYASLPAVRMAMGLSLSEERDIDIVHTEMCGLHLNSNTHTPEQMVVQTLFADGHIKYCVGKANKGLRILNVHEKIIPDTEEDMTWIPSSFGMKMTLSREVPFKIRDSLPEFIHELCERAGVKKEGILAEGIFAIHPGGPKIIEAVQKKMELRDDQVTMSQKVLFERGNMSSATLPHVWHEIMKTEPAAGTKILSLAFGPGLTIFGSIFEVKA